jgi:RNA polymerase subunit RPABC4/transcription elongation factor Spt4
MSFPAILIGAALLIVSIPIVARPFLGKKRLKFLDGYKKSHKSRRSYEQSLLALRDLDFDHQLGVVAEADYQQIRTQLLAEAAKAHEQALQEDGDLDQFIETAVHDRRRQIGIGQGQCDYCGALLDPTDKFCTACGSEAGSTCPQCQQYVERGDNFCASCGVQLAITTGVVT